MDILTPKGQQSLADERKVAAWVERKFGVRYLETPKDKPAFVDALIFDEKEMAFRAVVEVKCRYDVDYAAFTKNYRNEWLVTWDKVQHAMSIARGLGVPCVGMLYLTKDKALLMQKISESNGRLSVPIRLETTQTQATTNGGLAVRTNAYIQMGTADVYKVD